MKTLSITIVVGTILALTGTADARHRHHRRHYDSFTGANVQMVQHPSGCPRSAFCGCGASVALFGHPIQELFLAANWFKFPRTSPSQGAVAVRRHHVFILREHREGDVWLVEDYNSGGHASRIHERSIAGYTIVNPRGSSYG